VYLMRDRFHRVIYVGKARDLRKRVSQYFTPSRTMRADLKTRALLEAIWDFEWHLAGSEPDRASRFFPRHKRPHSWRSSALNRPWLTLIALPWPSFRRKVKLPSYTFPLALFISKRLSALFLSS